MHNVQIFVIILVLICLLFSIQANAVSFHGIDLLGEYQLPDSFCFQISDECSGHSSFKQVSARDDGCFAVCSLHTDKRTNPAQVFSLHYIDIYDKEGNFIQELSFVTDLDNAIELTDTAVNVYFQTHIVSFNLNTNSISAYRIPSRSTIDNGLLFDLEKKTFISGGWEYTCTGGWLFYSTLTRSNTNETQILIDYSSTKESAIPIISIFVVFIFTLVVFFFIMHAKRKTNTI